MPHQQAVHMTAPDQLAQTSKQTLPTGNRPHMTHSGHCARNRSVFPWNAPSQCEMVTGQGFPSPYQPDKGRSAIYRTYLGPDSCWYALCAAIVGNRGKPSGESRFRSPASLDTKTSVPWQQVLLKLAQMVRIFPYKLLKEWEISKCLTSSMF